MQTDDRNEGKPAILTMAGIRKAFPGVKAISAADFELRAGEIHALVGENGAGKSTLIKILTGVYRADAGLVELKGRRIDFHSPIDAHKNGIAAIYQEFTLVALMTVRENLFLGREKSKWAFINAASERRAAASVFKKMGVDIDPESLVSELSVARQQLVEIARALLIDAEILILDEPTAALTPPEVASLFVILKDLAGRGISIIFISHRLDEIFAIADRVTIMRDGRTVETARTSDLTRRRLIEQMVGRTLEEEFPRTPSHRGEIGFEVRHLSGGPVGEVSFSVRHGEVLGIAGLMGAGRTEVARLIFGADPKTSGEILISGRAIDIRSPRDAIAQGICLLTEDRKAQGLVLGASARDNFSLPNLPAFSRLGFINHGFENMRFLDHVRKLNIRIARQEQRAEELSGGNQQKLLVARWLETNSRVIIFDEPTRGIDVGAKYEMYLLINDLAAQGKIIIVISSELPEILGISDRILVMREGKITGEIADAPRATQEEIMALAV
jgi:ribose transport system ATP-binding protein